MFFSSTDQSKIPGITMLTPSLTKSPVKAVIWLLVAILAVWSTRSERLSSDGFQGSPRDQNHRYSVLRVGIMAEAHPLPPSSSYPHGPAVDTTTDETRAFIESLFTAVALDNFGKSFAAALSDDLVWTVTGSSPIAGRYAGKQVYIDKVLTPLRAVLVSLPVPIVEHIVVDGEWAVVNWRSEGVKGK